MGLLDYLFDPGTYGDPQGGLLSRLSAMQGNFAGAGFPAQNNQPSPLDNAQWPQGPVGAPSTAPSSFAERFNALPNAPQPVMPSGRNFDETFAQVPNGPNQAQPISVGGYQMPRVGNADLFNPQQMNLPPNAQPAQGQMQPPQMQAPQMPQQQMQQQLPTFLNNQGGFGAGLRGFVNNLHNGPVGALVGGIGNALGMQDQSQQAQRDLFNAYRGAGLTQSQAMLATMNPKLAENMLGLGGTDDIKEYQFAKREDPSLTFAKFMMQKKANQGEYSLNPVYGTNEKGEPVLMQTGKSGEAIQTKLPPGVKVSSGIEKVDLGTHWALYDKKSGVSLGTQPKDLQGKEAAEERGKVQGQAQAALPGAIADAEATKTKIDELLKNEGLNSIVGPLDQFRPSWMLGESGRDALARYKQLQGQAFLQAYGLLRGGGAITDIEGKKAESAMVRMDRAQSEDDFKQALRDFRDAIDIGVKKLRDRAGGGSAPSSASSPPQRIRLNADGTIAQ